MLECKMYGIILLSRTNLAFKNKKEPRKKRKSAALNRSNTVFEIYISFRGKLQILKSRFPINKANSSLSSEKKCNCSFE